MKNDTRRGRDLIKRTAVPPGDRMSRIVQNIKSLTTNEDFMKPLKPWGFNFNPTPIVVPARRLPTPPLRNGAVPIDVKSHSESWDVKFSWPMFRSAPFDKWAVVVDAQIMQREGGDFMRSLHKVAADLKINLSDPRIVTTRDNRPGSYRQAVETEVARLQPNFVLILVPRNTEDPYRGIKSFLCKNGVPSQVVTQNTIQKGVLTIATKVLIQMNCKAGGAPWTVDLKLDSPTMFIGLDIHHGGDLEKKSGSVAAFVASIDKDVTKFYSRTFVVRSKQQIFQPIDGPGLGQLTKDAIAAFKTYNRGHAPLNIVVYRDGGSEGELESLLKHEVSEMTDALEGKANLVFFVVLKKIRTRFFPYANGEVQNPQPGTIIDTHITNSKLPEFYLCCQFVNQGSATPTKYQKIYDTSKFNSDTLQMYTYGLSHLYFNWDGTIRTPCVCKYASTLAKFSGQFLRGRESNSALFQKLYYL
eukprot:NODE_990_length_1774_cov_28.196522_g873_i0.p1 GENE.NODE_990_length_1774_cov_28.196522_g873_i0~~NODE_990_length_1774_cov_28.196522_g873_i0.p1  ORF type:complete len:496 (+),score=82.70 NODE_990_length_1774_cov_28.196522_g873_i0:78-1490(+)